MKSYLVVKCNIARTGQALLKRVVLRCFREHGRPSEFQGNGETGISMRGHLGALPA
jgi:hypothetical protein